MLVGTCSVDTVLLAGVAQPADLLPGPDDEVRQAEGERGPVLPRPALADKLPAGRIIYELRLTQYCRIASTLNCQSAYLKQCQRLVCAQFTLFARDIYMLTCCVVDSNKTVRLTSWSWARPAARARRRWRGGWWPAAAAAGAGAGAGRPSLPAAQHCCGLVVSSTARPDWRWPPSRAVASTAGQLSGAPPPPGLLPPVL